MNYVVAIPTYNRHKEVQQKTLKTLLEGGVNPSDIYIFVANEEQEKIYEANVPRDMYNKIIVGKKGITHQRIFISRYFPVGQYVVSIDDDVEAIEKLNGNKLEKICNVDKFFRDAYSILKREGLYLWGIYPVRNTFYMKDSMTTELKFVIGVLHGYIARHLKNLTATQKFLGKSCKS